MIDAGCTAILPSKNVFWGDRFAEVLDTPGHAWSPATNAERPRSVLRAGAPEWRA